jgi:acyl carrier protein
MTNELSANAEHEILQCVRSHLGEVIGDPELLYTEITMETKFGSDLELESIEFVSLASHLSTEFGDKVNFVEFLSEKDVDEIISLTIGDVVRFVESSLRDEKSSQGVVINGIHNR